VSNLFRYARAREEQTFSNAGSGSSATEVQVAPLIDVLLVLIVVFMVTVSMAKQKGLEAEIPQPAPQTKSSSPERTIVIQVKWNADDEPSSPKINNQGIGWSDLHNRLQEISEPGLHASGANAHDAKLLRERRGPSTPIRMTMGDGANDERLTTNDGLYESLARTLIQMGVPMKPKALRIWFSRKR
jgi:biopolymer transport protein ExbD